MSGLASLKRHSSQAANHTNGLCLPHSPSQNTARDYGSGSRNRQIQTYIDHRILKFDMKPVVGDGDHSIVCVAKILYPLTLQHSEWDLERRHHSLGHMLSTLHTINAKSRSSYCLHNASPVGNHIDVLSVRC